MTPQPVFRRTANGFFQHFKIASGQLVFCHCRHIPSDQPKLGFIIASLHTTEFQIKRRLLHLTRYAFGTRQHGGVMVQEVAPVVNVSPVRHLIGYKPDDHRLTFLTIAHQFAQRVVHGNAHRAKPLAQRKEKLIELSILDGMIYLSALRLRRHPKRKCRHPLPIAIVTQVNGTRLTLVDGLIDSLHALEHHPSTQLIFLHGHKLHALHQIVAEEMEEAALHGEQFLLRLLGKRCREILSDNGPAIAHHVINQEEQPVAQHVEDAQRQQRKHIPQGIDNRIDYLHAAKVRIKV